MHTTSVHILIGRQALYGVVGILHQLLCQAGSQSAADVIHQKLVRAPHALYHTAEHPQGKHVEEDVHETAVQKHIGEELVEVEVAGQEKMQSEERCQIDATQFEHPRCHICQKVYHQQVLRHGRHVVHIY